MVGLPWEEHEDVEGIVTLTEQIRERMIQVGRARGRVGRIHPSVNPFVPKPGTPYQWLPMEDPKETDRKLQFLRKAFGRMPNVDAMIKSARTGVSQSILALGDRRVADALEYAAVQNVDLKRGMKAVGLDPALLSVPRTRTRGEPALGHRRQRREQGLLPARAGQERAGEALAALPRDPGLHPLRRVRRDAEPVLSPAREVEGARHLAAVPQGGRLVKGARAMISVDDRGLPGHGRLRQQGRHAFRREDPPRPRVHAGAGAVGGRGRRLRLTLKSVTPQLPRRAERCIGLTQPVTSPGHAPGGVRPQTRRFVHVAAVLVPGAADTS